jgi:hypothetical protein
MFYEPKFGMNMVMEAHELGFRLIPFSRFAAKNKVSAMYGFGSLPSSPRLEPGLRWAAKFLGTGYDFGGLIGMAFVLLFSKFKVAIRNPFDSPKAMFCSEIAVHVLHQSSVAMEATPSRTSPQQLWDLLDKLADTGIAARVASVPDSVSH